MPDIHSFCRNIDSEKNEFKELYKYYDRFLKTLGLSYTLAFRTTENFWEDNRKFILADKIEERKIRVDIDDREITVSKKIREAETECIPYIVVIGENEVNSVIYKVRVRRERKMKEMTYDDIIKEISYLTKERPYRELYFPRYPSKRIRF
jgi:threonyl-tRNA synthetase